jgi:predicted hydrolase (HD superfamily)
MKKPTNRVRPNGSTKAVKSQAQTAPGKTVTVIFYCAGDRREFSRVEFPEPIYKAIVRACKKLGITLGKYVELALERKFGRAAAAA